MLAGAPQWHQTRGCWSTMKRIRLVERMPGEVATIAPMRNGFSTRGRTVVTFLVWWWEGVPSFGVIGSCSLRRTWSDWLNSRVIPWQWTWDSKSWNSHVCLPWREKLDAGWVDFVSGRRLVFVGYFSCSARQCRDSRVPKGHVVTWPQFLLHENVHIANKSKGRPREIA